jgi:hypothetical protein
MLLLQNQTSAHRAKKPKDFFGIIFFVGNQSFIQNFKTPQNFITEFILLFYCHHSIFCN